MKLTALVVAFAAVVAAVPAGAQAGKTDLTGKWTFTVQTDNGTGTPTVTLQQKGDSLTGHYSSQVLGEQELKGMVKGTEFHVGFAASMQGQSVTVTYKGTIEADGSLKGSVDFGGYGGGTFTAKRQQ